MPKTIAELARRLFWSFSFPIAFLNGWLLLLVLQYFQPLITIITAAILLSFVLDYPVRWLESRRVGRSQSVVVVLLITLIVLGSLALVLFPLVLSQVEELLTKSLPIWVESVRKQLQDLPNWTLMQGVSIDLNQLTNRLYSELQTVTTRLLTLAFDTIGGLLSLLLTLVLTFYFSLNGEPLWNGLFSWVPTSWRDQIRRSLQQSFHNYFLGQVILASLASTFLTLAFLVMRVPFGLLFGLGIGVMTLVPFGGMFTAVILSLLFSLQDFWLGVRVIIVAVIILQVNDNVIAPRILGGMTGLNPVWILMSLLIGTKIGGVLGLFLAVPLASFMKLNVDVLRARQHPPDPILSMQAEPKLEQASPPQALAEQESPEKLSLDPAEPQAATTEKRSS